MAAHFSLSPPFTAPPSSASHHLPPLSVPNHHFTPIPPSLPLSPLPPCLSVLEVVMSGWAAGREEGTQWCNAGAADKSQQARERRGGENETEGWRERLGEERRLRCSRKRQQAGGSWQRDVRVLIRGESRREVLTEGAGKWIMRERGHKGGR